MIVNVIVPVYNVEFYLFRCIDSLLAQSFTDFELILVDDGSQDNSGSICDDYANANSRIHVIHKQNGGLSDARNAGIDYAMQQADCEWITFIDSDDWVHPRYLELLYNAVIYHDVNVSVCGYERTYGTLQRQKYENFEIDILNTERFFCEKNINATVAWGKLYKKGLFNSIRFPYGKIHEDEYTTYKVLFKNDNIAVIEAPMYYYYQNPSGIMKSDWSEKKLDLVFSREECCAYLYENSFWTAYDFALKQLLHTIVALIKKDSELSDCEQHKVIYPLLVKHLRRGIKLAKHRQLISFNNSKDKLFYDYAYPKQMRRYWMIKKVLKKQ